jgi:ATP-dependent RNA helicase RhlE
MNLVSADSFQGHGIAPAILDILEKNKFVKPTPIQHASIPGGVEGKDIIGIAQTGTGKTLAFSIPMIQRILADGGNGLIILPTRELAMQVDETIRKIGGPLGIRTAVFIGGASMGMQKDMIRKQPHIVIATPGRLIDHLERRNITLTRVKVLVLDEADRMLDMGFAPQINKILQLVPKERQTLLFSATMPQDIVSIAMKHMKLPLRVEVAPAGTTAERVVQELFIVKKEDKLKLLESLLGEYNGSVLVFSRTKFGAKKITKSLSMSGHKAAEIHGNRSLGQRTDALNGFKNGRYRVLVATDIAARGIDVTGIELVINYDLPNDPEDYVHRIGRTARAGLEGKAISFAQPEQRDELRRIERVIRTPIARKQLPPHMAHAHAKMDEPPPRPEHSVSSGSVRSRGPRKKWRVNRSPKGR